MIRPIVLIILDGWGIAADNPGNAITRGNTPTMKQLVAGFPHTQLVASGEAVGLPHGEDGNTETGHLNIGAGQIVYQDLPRINMSIADGTFLENPAFNNAIHHVLTNKSNIHLIGLVGAGGVHSNTEHLFALMKLCKLKNVERVYLHLITDGRDSPPTSALTYVSQVKQQIDSIGIGTIATVIGRYFAMDRDRRWERTAKAYGALTKGQGNFAKSAEEAIRASYANKKTDEFIEPAVIVDDQDQPVACVKSKDAIIFINFRIDRPRQLTKAFVLPNFEQEARHEEFDPFAVKYFKKHIAERVVQTKLFDRGEKINDLYFVTMTQYEPHLPVDVAFPPQFILMPIGRVISEKGFRQVRISESEKERFVTYYFNGQREDPFPGEDRAIVPSPSVATYDLKPEMSTEELKIRLVELLRAGRHDFYLINIACPDMVAHTGNIEATMKACCVADSFVNTAVTQTLGVGGAVVVTADHGNAEELINLSTNEPDTEHSVNPVPFIIVSKEFQGHPTQLQSGILADVSPTILKLMGIEKPESMTGRSLL